jgi:hypothetical protein
MYACTGAPLIFSVTGAPFSRCVLLLQRIVKLSLCIRQLVLRPAPKSPFIVGGMLALQCSGMLRLTFQVTGALAKVIMGG